MAALKKYFFIILLLELFFSYSPAYAQTSATQPYTGVDTQISKYLCTPGSSSSVQNMDLYACINKLYQFSIISACVIGVFFLVIAGYVYMGSEGNQESVDKAKNILQSTVASLVILFAGYLLLKTLNPDLVEFHSIQPPPSPTLTQPAIPPTTIIPTPGTGGPTGNTPVT